MKVNLSSPTKIIYPKIIFHLDPHPPPAKLGQLGPLLWALNIFARMTVPMMAEMMMAILMITLPNAICATHATL